MSCLVSAVEKLRDSRAIDPVVCRNEDGTYECTSSINITDEVIMCEKSDFQAWLGDCPIEDAGRDSCVEFAHDVINGTMSVD